MNEKRLALESRQLQLLKIMADSDAHASKCVKLGISFQESYPDDYAAYVAARDEYNRNEEELANLPDDEILNEEGDGIIDEQ